MKPYTYYISWSAISKSYYGVKYGKDANPDTFWKDYFTSSKYVKEMREKYGDPDIIQVRKVFSEAKEAIRWEDKVLNRIKAVGREDWINKGNINKNSAYPKSKEWRLRNREWNLKNKPTARKFNLYSTMLDKHYTFNTWREQYAEIGLSSKILNKLYKEGEWTVQMRMPATRHPFPKGDTIIFKDSTS